DPARVLAFFSGKPFREPLLPVDSNLAVFSPDGSRIVTADSDNTSRVWDVSSGKPLSPPLYHNGTVQSVAFSPDGSKIVTTSSDETVRAWDVSSGKPLGEQLRLESNVLSAALRPIILSAALSSDGSKIVIASSDNTARVWDA